MKKTIKTNKGDIISIEKLEYKCNWFAGVNGRTVLGERVTYKDNFGGIWCKVQGIWYRAEDAKSFYKEQDKQYTAVDFS